jgi:CBS domain-containing protein
MSPDVHACRPEEHVYDALARMATFHVGRLAVIDETDDIKGVLSIEDVVLWAGGTPGVSMHALIAALRSIYSRTSRVAATEL